MSELNGTVYIGREKCGCIVAAVFLRPSDLSDMQTNSALADIGRMVVDGYLVEKRDGPVQFEKCAEHKKP
jgi:hypothetical protein